MERFSVKSRKPDPTNPQHGSFLVTKNIRAGGSWVWLTKSCPHWSLASETTREAATYWKQLLCQCENGNCADLFAVLVTLGSSALNKRYWDRFHLVVLLPSILLCSLPQPSHAGQLEKEDSVDQKSQNKTSPVQIWAHEAALHRVWEIFVGGKFCDTRVNHENNEN